MIRHLKSYFVEVFARCNVRTLFFFIYKSNLFLEVCRRCFPQIGVASMEAEIGRNIMICLLSLFKHWNLMSSAALLHQLPRGMPAE